MTFIKKYWSEILLTIITTLIFFAGYHLRVLQEASDEIKEMKHEIKISDTAALEYEKTLAAINSGNEELNQQLKVTYAETGNRCLIPTNGLRLIQQANR